MAQVWTEKRKAFVQRFSNTVLNLTKAADELSALCKEYTDMFYGTGGQNAITDAEVQGALPAATAGNVATAHAALAGANEILAEIASNRGYLEMMRP